MKIGIMGGTFDPVHNGHLKIAECAYKELALDFVIFMPNHIPWMKKDERRISDDFHRLNMVKLAIEDYPYFRCSSLEVDRKGNSYTYETLAELKKQYKEDDLYFIMGADSLLQFDKWYHPELILQNAVIVTAVRDDCSMQQLKQQMDFLLKSYSGSIILLQMERIDISSTNIRTAQSMDELSRFLPKKVCEYITQNHLYHF